MWNRIKMSLTRLMSGRYGADQLGVTCLWSAVILTLLGSLTGLSVFSLVATVLYIWAIYRMFSRNLVKRRMENDKFTGWITPFTTRARQFITRLKLRKQYKYFHCPQCKSMLKLPRKVGEVTMTCGKCGHQFKQKA